MSKKIKYVPPMAELVLLAPCESLATIDWGFQKTWDHKGYFTENGASAIAVTGRFDSDGDYISEGSGFVIKTK